MAAVRSVSTSLSDMQSSLNTKIEEAGSILDVMSRSPDFSSRSPIRLQTSISRMNCTARLCPCRCHKVTKRTLPRWLRQVVGALLIGYFGIPFSYSCNERSCQRQDWSLLTVTYYFPWWFWSRSAISFHDRWDVVKGHEISVRTPRCISEFSPIFKMTRLGNMKGMQDLFASGLASPFDVNSETGDTVLHYAITGCNLDGAVFLLNQYADPYFESSDLKLSPIDELWNYILAGDDRCDQLLKQHSTQERLEALKAFSPVLAPFLDINENLQKRNFTTSHKIVLGLSSIDLEAQLETCPGDIDASCSHNRIPLHYATTSHKHVKTLIEFGSSIHIQDDRGRNPVHQAAMYGTVESLEILLVAAASRQLPSTLSQSSWQNLLPSRMINSRTPSTLPPTSYLDLVLEQPDKEYWTPLFLASGRVGGSLHVKLLLDYSANTNGSEHAFVPPVLLSILHNCHATLDLLLGRNAKIDRKDPKEMPLEEMGLLHIAAVNGDFETLTILKRYAERIREHCNVEDKDVYGHTPLQAFDNHRQLYVAEDEDMRLKSREEFLSILGLEPEEPRIVSIEEAAEEIEDPESLSEFSDSDDSDIFLDVEQDAEELI